MVDTFPELTEVAPNEPITAEAWNRLIDAITALQHELGALQSQRPGWIVATVRAEDGATPGQEVDAGQITSVTASPGAGDTRSFAARRVRGRYIISDLPPGTYDVHVAPTIASGYTPALRRDVQVQPGGAVVIDVVLARAAVEGARPRVPDLFNLALQDAVDLLLLHGIRPGQVLDAHGQSVTLTTTTDAGTGTVHVTVPPEFAQRPVVSTEPGEGTEVTAGGEVSLLISTAGRAAVEPVTVMRVPEVFNLTLQQALDALAAAHLVPGTVLTAAGQVIAVGTTTDPATGEVAYHAPDSVAARRVLSSEPSAGVLVAVANQVDLGIAGGMTA